MRPRLAWLGREHYRAGMAGHFDIRPVPLGDDEVLDWDAIVDRAGGPPDALLYVDRSLPPPLIGLTAMPCFTAFHCVDSHIHSWAPAWAQGFDACAVSLKDHLPAFRGRLSPERLRWLPPCSPVPAAFPGLPEAEKTFDLLFAGHVDPATTPERARFLAALGERLPGLTATRGSFATLFPRARLILNIAERGDLNFRVFEALAWGGCLLTPAIGHGQAELFEDGRHLFTYPAGSPGDVEAVAALAEALLPDAARREAVGRAGHALVLARHGHVHRGEEMAAWLLSLPWGEMVASRLAWAGGKRTDPWLGQLRAIHLHWAEAFRGAPRGEAYLREARRLAGG